MQKKYGVNPQLNDQDRQGLNIYKDRAEERRKEQGSDNPFEATQSSSLDVAIDESNKGFKMLSKLGWKQGEGLGNQNNQGIVEPIKIVKY